MISSDPSANIRIKNSVSDGLRAGDRKRALTPAETNALLEAAEHHTDSGQSVMFLEPHQKPNSFLEPVFSSFSRWSG